MLWKMIKMEAWARPRRQRKIDQISEITNWSSIENTSAQVIV